MITFHNLFINKSFDKKIMYFGHIYSSLVIARYDKSFLISIIIILAVSFCIY